MDFLPDSGTSYTRSCPTLFSWAGISISLLDLNDDNMGIPKNTKTKEEEKSILIQIKYPP